MIANIVDKRSNRYNVSCDVAYEPSANDNSIKGATFFSWGGESFMYDQLTHTTIVEAIEYGNQWDCPVTMYVYDKDVLAVDSHR